MDEVLTIRTTVDAVGDLPAFHIRIEIDTQTLARRIIEQLLLSSAHGGHAGAVLASEREGRPKTIEIERGVVAQVTAIEPCNDPDNI
mgnify:CR=1 FL=1